MLQWLAPPKFTSLANVVKTVSIQPTVFSCNKLIESYSKNGRPEEARRLFDEMPERNVFTWNAMIHGCIRYEDLVGARSLFDSAPVKDSVTYNSMISGYVAESCESEAIELFDEMRRSGARVDGYTLTTILNVIAKLRDIDYGRQIHACVVKTASDTDSFGVSSLIDMYSKCGCFPDAYGAFDGFGEMGDLDLVGKNAMVAACCREGKMEMAFDLFRGVQARNDVVSWNTLISGFVQNGRVDMAMGLFVKMGSDGVGRNQHTIAIVLMACSSLKSLKHGKEIHAWVLKNGFDSNPFINSGIVDFYCKCNELRYAELVWSRCCKENVFSATSMIVSYSERGKLEEARNFFDSLGEKNSVVWTAIFTGYAKYQQCNEVLDLFREAVLKHDPVVSDMLVLISVLGACATQADLDHGKQIHTYLTRIGVNIEEKVGTALVDMYAKCGNIECAENVFWRVSSKDRVLYNAMISGLAHNGQGAEAIQLFEEMLNRGLLPDSITFIALLSACRHSGLVERGEEFFNSMMTKYEIVPEIDHYSSMVDLLGRANQLEKAVSLIKSIPFEPDAIIWGTLLNACRMNRNTMLAKEIEEKLLRMEVRNGARYVQLANAFASKGEWTEVEKIRRKMRGGVKKLAGCSWVQVDKKVNAFISGDMFHPEAKAVFEMLTTLNTEMMDDDIVML